MFVFLSITLYSAFSYLGEKVKPLTFHRCRSSEMFQRGRKAGGFSSLRGAGCAQSESARSRTLKKYISVNTEVEQQWEIF